MYDNHMAIITWEKRLLIFRLNHKDTGDLRKYEGVGKLEEVLTGRYKSRSQRSFLLCIQPCFTTEIHIM